MLYNVYLEVASFVFLGIALFFHIKQYTNKTVLNARFRVMVLCAMVMVFTDVLSAITISYYRYVPVWVNTLFNMLNYIFIAISGFAFTRYIEAVVSDGRDKIRDILNLVIAIIFVILSLFNCYYGFFFTFDREKGYLHGPLYVAELLFCYYFVFIAALILLTNVRKLTRKQAISTGSYILVNLLFNLVQTVLMPHVLLSGFAITITLMIILFTLETPDYGKLIATMEELNTSREEANRANEAKTIFLANMSHEIRTPLNAILGMDEMILRTSKEKDSLEYAQNIQRAGNSLLSIINDILDFSKIESGKMEIVEDDFQLREMLQNIVNMMDLKAKSKGLRLEVTVDPELPAHLYGDMGRIQQVLLNLLNNAVKYTERGYVSFQVTGENKTEREIQLKAVIADTGIGIRDEDKEKLFQGFQRLDLKKNQNIEGTGLGLAITDKLVHQMNGTLQLESEYGKGSIFTASIPLYFAGEEKLGNFTVQEKDAAIIRQTGKPKFTAPDAHVLLVDDNDMNLMVAERLLAKNQVAVDHCTSGLQMLSQIREKKYDLIFLDHMMPEMDGIETLHKMREDKTHLNQDTPVIALTANAVIGAKDMYLSEGFSGYISKPIDPGALEETLRKYLEH